MKKTIFILLLTTICCLYLLINTKQVAPSITNTIQDLAVPGPVEILPDPITIVKAMKELARLETSSMTFEKIIPGTRDNERFNGVFGETILFVAVGEVIAGIDLETIQEDDIQIININTVKVHLPPAEIFNVILDNKNSYVADRDKGFLADYDPLLETKVRSKAQQALEESALKSDLLEKADIKAQNITRTFLQRFGLKNIYFF